MTIPILEQADLDQLKKTLPDLDFSDAERQAVLLESTTRDIQAAPGSGKTTLLAAKLLMLAEKWPYTNRGICVLSHTNVASDEITKRLSTTNAGAKLLGYPHFVGTIQTFVNQFMALPLLRSDGKTIDVIDNDVFAANALSRLKTKYTLDAWVRRNDTQGPAAIRTLHYIGPELIIGWDEGSLPNQSTTSGKEAQELKNQISAAGIFRYDDMFAFAERLLQRCPNLSQRLSHRFPLVLIDEMQDTNWVQEELLSRVFNTTVVMQRYGDRNQRILNSGADVANLTFPKNNHLSVTTTKRFSENIATVVRAVQEHGEPVTANIKTDALQPVLILYCPSRIDSVIDTFGKYVLNSLSDEELQQGSVKAICARKQGTSNVVPGRMISDYWPNYVNNLVIQNGEESIFFLLGDPPAMGTSFNLYLRSRDVKRAILLVLRSAGSEAVVGIRDVSHFLRKLNTTSANITAVRMLCHELTVGHGHTVDETSWKNTVNVIYDRLSPLISIPMNRQEFNALNIFEIPIRLTPEVSEPNKHIVEIGNRSLTVQIGTIASVKGETHAATLVMESYDGRGRRFDLLSAFSSITNGDPLSPRAPETLRGLYRNLYVAVSRPSQLLCLAMNSSRADKDQIRILESKGWGIIHLT